MKKVSLFDVRAIIGALMLLYGLVLLITSFSTSEAEKARADGINANLWVGLALLVFGVLMAVWAVTRPIEIDEEQLEADKRAVEEATVRSREAAHQAVDGDHGDHGDHTRHRREDGSTA